MSSKDRARSVEMDIIQMELRNDRRRDRVGGSNSSGELNLLARMRRMTTSERRRQDNEYRSRVLQKFLDPTSP